MLWVYVLVLNESKLKASKQIIAFKIITMLIIVLEKDDIIFLAAWVRRRA